MGIPHKIYRKDQLHLINRDNEGRILVDWLHIKVLSRMLQTALNACKKFMKVIIYPVKI
jgi:hypothetical protein